MRMMNDDFVADERHPPPMMANRRRPDCSNEPAAGEDISIPPRVCITAYSKPTGCLHLFQTVVWVRLLPTGRIACRYAPRLKGNWSCVVQVELITHGHRKSHC